MQGIVNVTHIPKEEPIIGSRAEKKLIKFDVMTENNTVQEVRASHASRDSLYRLGMREALMALLSTLPFIKYATKTWAKSKRFAIPRVQL